MDERRELEVLQTENATFRVERAHSRSQVFASVPTLAPRKIVTRVSDDEGVMVQDFLKLKTPDFRGEEGEDPQEFLEETKKMTQRLTYSMARAIELVGITMKDNAWEWYQRSIEDRLYNSDLPTWEESK